MTYVTNTAQTLHGEAGLFIAGVVCLSAVCLLTYRALKAAGAGKEGSTDWIFYVFTFGTFASAVDLIIGLETDGYIRGFMSVYLQNGEPYLGTPYGSLISYWDGTAHYAMYLFMLAAITYKWNYREVGLYWAGSIGHSMLVLIPGAILGRYGVRWSFLLNVPYIFIPFVSAARFLREAPMTKNVTAVDDEQLKKTILNSDSKSSLWRRPIDVVFVISLFISIAVCLIRGFAVLGWRNEIATTYLTYYEPYLVDPVVFPRIQMLIYLFYFVPFYIAAVYALLQPGCTWMPDWNLLFAGAAAQAQVPHILGSLHDRTTSEFRVPDDKSARIVFWSVNLLLLLLPQLIAVRCWLNPKHFYPYPRMSCDDTNADNKAKKN